MLEQALSAARQTASTRLVSTTLRWDSPTSGPQQAQVDYQVDPATDAIQALVQGARIDLAAPIKLQSVTVPKPWGEERWFTGMEARGEAVVLAADQQLPLSQYLALAPTWIHQRSPIVLLKILAPRPEPVLGDLYFEVHEQKEETYVVTAVDAQAWPNGVGAIRYGVNQDKRHSFASDEAFRSAYLAAVQGYEAVRRLLDGEPTPAALDDVALEQAANSAEPKAALARIERARREAMESFTQLLPLAVGDIVCVPPWQPHSLQHGVTVVEFQSPTYERFIISFAQQVITQSHWDSAEAIARMSLAPLDPAPPVDPHLPPQAVRIARYSDFGALRVKVSEAAPHYPLEPSLPYVVAICIRGNARCGALHLCAGEACFVPARGLRQGLGLETLDEEALILIAAPGL